MVSIHSPISNPSSSLSKPFQTSSSTPITIGITTNFMFHSFLSSLARSKYFSLFLLSLIFHSVVNTMQQLLFILLIITIKVWSSGQVYVICLGLKIPENFIYLILRNMVVWSNFNFLHNSQWITFPTQSCLVLYSFWASLLPSLIMGLMVSSISPHNLHSDKYPWERYEPLILPAMG